MNTEVRKLDAAWSQRALNAMRSTLDAPPELKRQMVEFLLDENLWDSSKLAFDSAIVRYNANLNPEKPQFFTVREVWALMRCFHRYDLLYAINEDCGFDQPRHRSDEERRQMLLERIAAGQEAYNILLAEVGGDLRRLETSAAEVRIHPRLRGNGGNFALDADGPVDSALPGAF